MRQEEFGCDLVGSDTLPEGLHTKVIESMVVRGGIEKRAYAHEVVLESRFGQTAGLFSERWLLLELLDERPACRAGWCILSIDRLHE